MAGPVKADECSYKDMPTGHSIRGRDFNFSLFKFNFFLPTSRLIHKGKQYPISASWAHWTATKLSTCSLAHFLLPDRECIIVTIDFTHAHELQHELCCGECVCAVLLSASAPFFFFFKVCRTVVVFSALAFAVELKVAHSKIHMYSKATSPQALLILFVCYFTNQCSWKVTLGVVVAGGDKTSDERWPFCTVIKVCPYIDVCVDWVQQFRRTSVCVCVRSVFEGALVNNETKSLTKRKKKEEKTWQMFASVCVSPFAFWKLWAY